MINILVNISKSISNFFDIKIKRNLRQRETDGSIRFKHANPSVTLKEKITQTVNLSHPH